MKQSNKQLKRSCKLTMSNKKKNQTFLTCDRTCLNHSFVMLKLNFDQLSYIENIRCVIMLQVYSCRIKFKQSFKYILMSHLSKTLELKKYNVYTSRKRDLNFYCTCISISIMHRCLVILGIKFQSVSELL